MRSLITGFGLLALTAAPVLAADLPVKARPMVPVAVAYNWTGCYIGVNGGGKWGGRSGDATIGATTASVARTVTFDTATASTAIFGGQIGCNWQAPGSN